MGHEAFAQWRREQPQDYLKTLGKWEGDKRLYDPLALAEGEVPGSYVPILPSLLAYISLEDRQALRWAKQPGMQLLWAWLLGQPAADQLCMMPARISGP